MASEPFLSVELKHQLGMLALEVAFEIRAPWTVLFGPSGSGKSTILRGVAGLLRPDAGKVQVLGQTVFDAQVWVPAHQRPVRWAGQRSALFPHKSVQQNLAMGVDIASRMDMDRGLRVDRALKLFGLESLQNKFPEQLSGGQRQMVSIVRASMSAESKVLLLDEPFAGLDAGLRDQLIANLKSWLGVMPVISVTHDVGEAFLLGAEVVRIAEGRVVAQGPVGEVLAGERERLLGVLG